MNHNKEEVIGKFYAYAYNKQKYEFFVKNNDLIYCNQISKDKGITRFIIKPNFWAFIEDNDYITCDMLARKKDNKIGNQYLIHSYIIPNDLLEYLILRGMISYSTDMAYLYKLNPKYASDKWEKTRAFKKVKRKNGTILEKQKQGIFN